MQIRGQNDPFHPLFNNTKVRRKRVSSALVGIRRRLSNNSHNKKNVNQPFGETSFNASKTIRYSISRKSICKRFQRGLLKIKNGSVDPNVEIFSESEESQHKTGKNRKLLYSNLSNNMETRSLRGFKDTGKGFLSPNRSVQILSKKRTSMLNFKCFSQENMNENKSISKMKKKNSFDSIMSQEISGRASVFENKSQMSENGEEKGMGSQSKGSWKRSNSNSQTRVQFLNVNTR